MPSLPLRLGRHAAIAALWACSNTQGQAGAKAPDSAPPQAARAVRSSPAAPLPAPDPKPVATVQPPVVPPVDNAPGVGKSEGTLLGRETLPEVELTYEALVEAGTRRRPEGAVAAAVADEALQVWNYGGSSSPGYISSRAGFHPGTRVIVDATPLFSARFSRSQAAAQVQRRLQAGLRNRGYWPFRLCFEEVSRSEAKLGGGKTRLRLTVGASGAVKGARLASSTVRSPALGRCLEQAAKSLRTDHPLGLRVQAEVTVSIWPGDLPVLPLLRQAALPRPTGAMELEEAISRQHDSIQACFVSGRRGDPAIWGRLELSFVVGSELRAVGIREESSHFPSPYVTSCVSLVLAQTTFSRDSQGQRISIGLRLAKPPAPERPQNAFEAEPSEGTPPEIPAGDAMPGAMGPPGAGDAPTP